MRADAAADRATGRGERTALTLTERLAVVYLALPLLIFQIGWFQWWVGLPAALLFVLAIREAASGWGSAPRVPLERRHLLLVLAAAFAWTALGGAGHLFFANFDWVTRDAVLRDLAAGSWPVGYGDLLGQQSVLRAPLGYYLPAAAAAKLVGVRLADPLLLAWTYLGTVLFFALVVETATTMRAALCTLAVMVFFSGMDLVGTVLRGGIGFAASLTPVDHLEWWATHFQYSSQTTQLFWAPNHALPGWIATVLLVRGLDQPAMLRLAPALVAAVMPWSPLTALGFAPIAAFAWFRGIGRFGARRIVDPVVLAGSLVSCSLIGAYLTMGIGTIHAGTTPGRGEPWTFFVPHYLQFVLLECGILWLLLLTVRRDGLLWIAGALLWLLPLVWFGPSNDLVMRASIPALLVLALATGEVLASPAEAMRKKVFWPILVIVLLGVPTALTEINRAIREPAWKPDLSKDLVAASGQSYPSHYVTAIDGGLVARILRPVKDVPERAAPRSAADDGVSR